MKVHLLYFAMSVSLANCLKTFSQFRLHIRLCLGIWVEKALCLPLRDVQVGLISISFMILFQTSQSRMKLYLILTQLAGLLHYQLHATPLLMVLPHQHQNVMDETEACPAKLGRKLSTAYHFLQINSH